MGAFVDHEFKKGFFLDEERIRKLNDILLSRGKLLQPECVPTYQVFRADTFTYVTTDIQQILEEDNADWQRIVRLIIKLESSDALKLELDFDKGETNLHIEGEDRDLVYLIFSELKQYLSNEVNIIRGLPGNKSFANVLLLLYIGFMAYFGYIADKPPSKSVSISPEQAISSSDLAEKLNFLIEYQTVPSSTGFTSIIWIGVVLMSVLFMINVIGKNRLLRPVKYLYPDYVFMVGKEIERHTKRQSLRQNILWGIVISSIIGIVTGLIVWVITK